MDGQTHQNFSELTRVLFLFAERHSNVATDFMSVFTYRNETRGFPEWALGERALPAVMEAMIKEWPSTKSLESAQALVNAESAQEVKLEQISPIVIEYVRAVTGILSELALVRPYALSEYFRIKSRTCANAMTYIISIHLEYISRKDHIPNG